jgi:phosphinothricin acetyltransferase
MIRLATANDASDCLAIYAPVVTGTAISFELEVPTVEEMRRRITETLPRYPWLVLEEPGGVRGYAYAGAHRQRPGYRWSVDVSVYVAATARRAGVGRRLYTSLLELLRLQGFVNAFAGVALPNEASVGLHEALGFQPIGVYRNVGFKLGRWIDVGWWQLQLQDLSDDLPGEPAPPLETLTVYRR